MTRRNNFDALRLVAAASVVFSHSFLIAEGTQDHEPLISSPTGLLTNMTPGSSCTV